MSQLIEIGSLDVRTAGGTQSENVWIPAALSPTEIISDGGAELNTDPLTQTITIGSDFSSAGLTYEVVSAVPTYTQEQLRAAAATLQPAPVNSDIYLQVPDSVPEAILETALEVTQSSDNRYDQAIALQNFFQGFEYSLDLEPRPADLTAEEHFLNTRTGFCQQFSGTFALMARLLGLPTRVAVGFTWGDVLEETPEGTRYGVKGRHAHAWPEVWFGDELGWVPFEPTPGRGIPGATQYTNLEPTQDVSPGFEEPETLETTPAEPEPDPTNPEEAETEEAQEQDQGEGVTEPENTEPEAAAKPIEFSTYTQRRTAVENFAPLLGFVSLSARTIGLLLLALSYPIGLPLFVVLRRRFRTNALNSASPSLQIRQSWELAKSEIRLNSGLVQADHETATEFATRFISNQGSNSAATLSGLYTTCKYRPDESSQAQGNLAVQELNNLVTSINRATPWQKRWRHALTPSRVFGSSSLKNLELGRSSRQTQSAVALQN